MQMGITKGDYGSSGPRFRFPAVAVISLLCAGLALATASECHSITHVPSLLYGIVLWGWWGCIAGGLRMLGARKPFILRFSPASIALHGDRLSCRGDSSLALGHGFIAGLARQSTNRNLDEPSQYQSSTEILPADSSSASLDNPERVPLFRAQSEAIKSLELQKQLSAAQLRALQMQLEPHFLFNTLNAITTLVELGRQAEAVEMLAHLNAILKSTLKRTAPEKVPLSQEFEIVENYLAIEQIRFADRLRIEIKVEPTVLDSLVPCFLLQPIVENAIRHGIAHYEDNGVVEASARRVGNLLRLEVRDSGSRFNGHSKPGTGIGLKNTRERLAHFYQEAYDMVAQPLDTGGFEVAITIPYERA